MGDSVANSAFTDPSVTLNLRANTPRVWNVFGSREGHVTAYNHVTVYNHETPRENAEDDEDP